MDRGFNLSINDLLYKTNAQSVRTFKADNSKRVGDLAQYMINEDAFDASLIINSLFPATKADIFLSHSHKDIDLAIQIALDLKRECGLTVFVDSCVWGSAHEILQAIDKKYCRRPGETTYNYDERNRSTAHVHMMLSTALQQMIDETDTIFFLNTNHSISLEHSIAGNEKTLSPWIHMELGFSSMVRRRPRKIFTKAMNERMLDSVGNESLQIVHDAPTSHLTNISWSNYTQWYGYASEAKGQRAIDNLYSRFK